MSSVSDKIILEINRCASPKKADILSRFFKTGKGEYGEGDIFKGVTIPEQRIIAKKYIDTSLGDLKGLLSSKIHEYRMVALIILTYKVLKNKGENLKEIYDFYIKNLPRINNWDLVDLSCPNIVGRYCFLNNKESVLNKLSKSKNLWEKRISIVSTLYFIKKGKTAIAYDMSNQLMSDKHDLIHKACGWMLREAGKINSSELEKYILKNATKMPRTMLRYAIERMPEQKRLNMLKLRA